MIEITNEVRFWLDVIGLVGGALGLLSGGAWWMIRHSLVTHTALETKMVPLHGTLGEHDRRITAVETGLRHLPTTDDWVALREQMLRMEGTIGNLGTQIGAVRETIERIERPLNVLIDGKLKAREA